MFLMCCDFVLILLEVLYLCCLTCCFVGIYSNHIKNESNVFISNTNDDIKPVSNSNLSTKEDINTAVNDIMESSDESSKNTINEFNNQSNRIDVDATSSLVVTDEVTIVATKKASDNASNKLGISTDKAFNKMKLTDVDDVTPPVGSTGIGVTVDDMTVGVDSAGGVDSYNEVNYISSALITKTLKKDTNVSIVAGTTLSHQLNENKEKNNNIDCKTDELFEFKNNTNDIKKFETIVKSLQLQYVYILS